VLSFLLFYGPSCLDYNDTYIHTLSFPFSVTGVRCLNFVADLRVNRAYFCRTTCYINIGHNNYLHVSISHKHRTHGTHKPKNNI